ncbi:unnamed protein product [Mytilus edulis]|uniref:C-type lectin domain-containing protein n=1 Tax=Mytilus edulis TaxID=6550 RepID=A0A8S3V7C3_MYTED|nr:unnamed protein product [Mytilus edulis]
MNYEMDSKLIWTVLCVLCFLPFEVKAGRCMTMTSNRMTWLESVSYCSLALKNSIHYLADGEYRGWAGGIFLNTQWMFHKGCYSNSGTTNSNSVYDIKMLTPTLCYLIILALQFNWCICLHSLYNLKEADSSKCTYRCLGSNNNVCGERSHYTVFHQIIGKFKPESDGDQQLACSVIVHRNDTFVLKAVDCTEIYWTACVISGVSRRTEFNETYLSALNRCSSLKGTILSTSDNLDKLEDGREYWSNIFRSRFLKWITNETFDVICYEVDGLQDYYSKNGEEISTRERPTSNTKHEKHEATAEQTSTEQTSAKETPTEQTSAKETKFTSTSMLTSFHESTDSSLLSTSTITYNSTTFSALSMPIKFTKDVVPSMPIMSTKFDYTKFANGSSTKEHHFSITSTFNKITTASTGEEISTRERPTSSSKHEKMKPQRKKLN